jgi:hypothetical protein
VNQIEFMFNPNEISFSRSMSLEQNAGTRNASGQNKTSFKHPNPYSLTINNIIFDTYEAVDGENNRESVTKYIQKFAKAVEFIKSSENSDGSSQANQRPPIYLFSWGKIQYMRCFVKNFSVKLSLFLPDGTPVRASVNLSLEQVELPTPERGQTTPNPTGSGRADPNFFGS